MSGSGIILQVSWNFLQDSKGGGKKKKKKEWKTSKSVSKWSLHWGEKLKHGRKASSPCPSRGRSSSHLLLEFFVQQGIEKSLCTPRSSTSQGMCGGQPLLRKTDHGRLWEGKGQGFSQHNWGGRVCWVRGQEANTPQSGNCHCEAAWRSGTGGCFLWAKNTVSTGSILKLRDKF